MLVSTIDRIGVTSKPQRVHLSLCHHCNRYECVRGPLCNIFLGDTDFYVASCSCSPYSTQVGANRTTLEIHKGFDTLWGEQGSVLARVKQLRPKVHVGEQVIGFGNKRAGKVFPDEYLEVLNSVGNLDGIGKFYRHVFWMKCNMLEFGSMNRNRCDM